MGLGCVGGEYPLWVQKKLKVTDGIGGCDEPMRNFPYVVHSLCIIRHRYQKPREPRFLSSLAIRLQPIQVKFDHLQVFRMPTDKLMRTTTNAGSFKCVRPGFFQPVNVRRQKDRFHYRLTSRRIAELVLDLDPWMLYC